MIPRGAKGVVLGTILASAAVASVSSTAPQETWRGLRVAPEERCTRYDPDDYRYSQRVEDAIIADLGGIYSPYTGEWFDTKRETDIEHLVARSEAHDSGLCAASADTRRRFANDSLNLTLASPSGESAPEERQGRGRVAAGEEPVLVCESGRPGAAEVRSLHRPARGGRTGSRSLPLRLRGDDPSGKEVEHRAIGGTGPRTTVDKTIQ